MSKGLAAYVLPRYENKPYISVNVSDYFGHLDIAIHENMLNVDLIAMKRAKKIMRRFTVRALVNCEMFTLTIKELEKMKLEFPEMYVELFDGAHRKFQRELIFKYEYMKR